MDWACFGMLKHSEHSKPAFMVTGLMHLHAVSVVVISSMTGNVSGAIAQLKPF